LGLTIPTNLHGQGNTKTANGSALGFDPQFWAAAEQAAPAARCKKTEYRGARREGLFGFSDPKSE